MVHRVLLQDLGGLELRFDQVLLQTLPHAILRFGDLLDLLELLLIAIENRQRLGVIEQLEIHLFYLFFYFTLRGFVTMLGVLSVSFRRGFLQTEVPGTRDILRDTEAGVVKIAALITREG